MKRCKTWSYVIGVTDPETGISKPKWVGGFPDEDAAKEARDEARVKARRGDYIDRNTITVGEYLDEWIDAHAVEIKPKTLANYRYLLERHVKPNIGCLRLQAVRPGQITKLYRDLVTTGGRRGTGLSPRTVARVHSVLRKAFGDAVRVDELIPSNPTERTKRPRLHHGEPGEVWTTTQLRTFLDAVTGHRLSASSGSPPTRVLGVGNSSTCDGATSTWTTRPSRSRAPPVHRRRAHRGEDQERTVPRGQHRRWDRGHPPGTPQAPARRQAQARQGMERRRQRGGRLRIRYRMG
ncbi:site-specific integrase [Actinomadura soli]|uniref:Site-specific integrase n=1 Tax=Actinomadura soli TaxID=2508997 RepID=A0A5C4IZS4_9ACTN|nr:N-terminal phage integrase SAM-like domain-containing protein [Actinomadura soli]TMQ89804.1 site-specific integrase [Actinomadura soli]